MEVRYVYDHEIPWGDIGFTSSVYAIEKYLESKSRAGAKTYIGSYISEGPENRKGYT
jgi:hypothetical protein